MKNISLILFFFFNDTATTEIYTLSLHDALPIWREHMPINRVNRLLTNQLDLTKILVSEREEFMQRDRKSTRLNSSHANISYAVFCLKKKKNIKCGTGYL